MSEYSYRYAHLLDLTDNELHNWLTLKGKRPSEILAIKASIKKQKSAKRSDNAKRKRLDADWRAVINPLVNEQRVVYGMKRYNKDRYPNPERKEALDAYDALLSKLKTKLRSYHAAYERSPLQQAAWEKERLGRDIPNNGCHWTDWVPDKVKNPITQAFAEIPHTFRARTKTPFERTIPPADNSKRKARLIKQIRNDTLNAEQELAMVNELTKGEPSEAQRDLLNQLTRIEDAMRMVMLMPDDVLVPDTWEELEKC